MKKIIKIIEILVLILLIGWLAIFLFDFFNVKNEENPQFCIKKDTKVYEDNKKTEICTGLGYKVYKYYENDELTATEFGPFFIEDKNAK